MKTIEMEKVKNRICSLEKSHLRCQPHRGVELFRKQLKRQKSNSKERSEPRRTFENT